MTAPMTASRSTPGAIPDRSRSEARLPTFASLDPATGEVVGEHPVHDEAAVRSAVEAARTAAVWWAELGWKQRRRRLLAWKGVLARRLGQLAQLVHTETGKPVADATLEVVLTLAHLDWAARNARRVLGPRRLRSGALAFNHAATVEYQPLGVVGVIGPWNYPVFTPMGSIAYALAAGNAVVFKPSEYTPSVGGYLARSLAEVVPEHPVLQVVTGFGETGAALCAGEQGARVDKIAFTGSIATAKRVMAACAETLTPVLCECGGKDALIVDGDADLDAAVDAATWGAMANAGQTCVGVERVYVVEKLYDEFVRRLTEHAAKLRPGDDREAHYGPITMPDQLDVIRRHVDDALRRGGRAVVGGTQALRPPYVDPIVLVDVPDDAPAVTEETFGPTVVVSKVRDLDEAVERANATGYGLAASVFSGNRRRARGAARRLRAGAVSINAVLAYASVPALPFGGVGDSGFGRIHGEDGLREFARAKAVTRQRFPLPLHVTSFHRGDADMKRLVAVAGLLHGRRPRNARRARPSPPPP